MWWECPEVLCFYASEYQASGTCQERRRCKYPNMKYLPYCICVCFETVYLCVQTIGSQVAVKIVKNKLAPPFRTAQFELEFGKGICKVTEIIELSIKHKFIAKNGTFYNLNGKNYHGKEALKKFLRLNEPVQEELMTKLKEKLIVDEAADKETESEEEEDSGRVLVSSESTDDEAPAPVVAAAAAAVVES